MLEELKELLRITKETRKKLDPIKEYWLYNFLNDVERKLEIEILSKEVE